jgi:hypothetical protein
MTSANKTALQTVRFHFVPVEDEDESGNDIFVTMQVPVDETARQQFHNELNDCVSSYIDSVEAWSFSQLALEVARSFDPNAAIQTLITVDV